MRTGLVAIAFVACSSVSVAQELRPGLSSLAIVNARIETEPGKVIERGTILMDSGKIIAVGEKVDIPAWAETLDGKGLFVYAGFVECGVTKGVKELPTPPRQFEPVDPTADFATSMMLSNPAVHADTLAIDSYDPDDAVWKASRSAGFTSAIILPTSGIIRGQAALVNLDGRSRRLATVASPIGLSLAMEGRQGGYPGTMLGAFSTIRQSFMDAERSRRSGNYVLGADPSLDSLLNFRASNLPVIIEADLSGRIDSVLNFADEYRLSPIVLGAKEGFRASRLGNGSRAIVKLDFGPEPMPTKPVDPKAKPEPPKEPEAKLRERQRIWLESVNNARELAKRGVQIAFTTAGVKDVGTFFENLRRAVTEGLPRDVALRALTLQPAAFSGQASHLGTIAPGRIANLTILTADFIDPKAKVRWLVIDGKKLDPGKEPFKFDNSKQNFGGEE